MNINEIWNRFSTADPITDEEMMALFWQVEAAMPYLESRGKEYYLARIETNRVKIDLEGYLKARGYIATYNNSSGKTKFIKKVKGNLNACI